MIYEFLASLLEYSSIYGQKLTVAQTHHWAHHGFPMLRIRNNGHLRGTIIRLLLLDLCRFLGECAMIFNEIWALESFSFLQSYMFKVIKQWDKLLSSLFPTSMKSRTDILVLWMQRDYIDKGKQQKIDSSKIYKKN